MAGGLGFVRDAQNRMAENRANLKNKSVYKDFVDYGSRQKAAPKYKEATPELLATIRETRMLENKSLKRRNRMLASFCGGIFLITLWLLLTL